MSLTDHVLALEAKCRFLEASLVKVDKELQEKKVDCFMIARMCANFMETHPSMATSGFLATLKSSVESLKEELEGPGAPLCQCGHTAPIHAVTPTEDSCTVDGCKCPYLLVVGV